MHSEADQCCQLSDFLVPDPDVKTRIILQLLSSREGQLPSVQSREENPPSLLHVHALIPPMFFLYSAFVCYRVCDSSMNLK